MNPTQILARLLLAGGLLFALDAALFRTSRYRSVVEPESYAGQTELMLRRVAAAPAGGVLVLGDSRVAEGFSARIANRMAGGRVTFVNGAVSGSTLRCWYYLLREADPDSSRFRAVVLPFDDYHDEDGVEDWADRVLDLRIVIFCLRLPDVGEFSDSVRAWSERFDGLRGSTLKGFMMKDDVQAFLLHPRQRMEKARQWARSGAEWVDSYEGNPASLAGAPVPAARKMSPQNGRYREYRRLWLGRILASGTRVWAIRMPRTPFPAQQPAEPLSSAIREVRPGALKIQDEGTFLDLEKPEFFFDSLHLNRKGREAFSERLAGLPF